MIPKEDTTPTKEVADEDKLDAEAHKEAHAGEHKRASDASKLRAKMTAATKPRYDFAFANATVTKC